MIFMKDLISNNNYSNMTTTLINLGNNKLVNENNPESSNESLSIIEKSIVCILNMHNDKHAQISK